ncbi:hypothetical protein [Limnofasciculus baicalensis]|uniref:Uncharacterized protein n=1 Tax=Limnofasciculus baicalensis BBK-W-15 TaxID=2699891 RepID=A0AAE3GNE9_9CYAN|nr:hypothetical protein [Limnofasciculus baicalensis]MCP2727119.1 hypothetical protein [Limnofasciculus baicalensis BBK-W-15]
MAADLITDVTDELWMDVVDGLAVFAGEQYTISVLRLVSGWIGVADVGTESANRWRG